MVKGKAKINSNDSLAPPQPRSLGSKKTEYPSDDIQETDDVEASHHQDTEGNTPAVDTTLLQCNQSPLRESTIVLTQQHEAVEQPRLSKQDHDTEEKHAEGTHVTVFDEQEETSATNPNDDSLQADSRICADKDGNTIRKDNEEMTAEEFKISPSQTCIDQLLPKCEEGNEAALEEHLDTKENSHCSFVESHETCREEPINVPMSDENDTSKEAGAGLPPKKKRRMGMCGLTERERSHFLQIQKRENGQDGSERVEKQIAGNSKAYLMAEEEITPSSSSSLSIPVGSVKNQEEAGTQLQFGHCGGDDRAETESSAVSDDMVPASQQTGHIKSKPPTEEEVTEGHEEQQEAGRGTAEQGTDGAVGSAAADHRPAHSPDSSLTQNKATKKQDAVQEVFLQVNSRSATKGEEKEELTGDTGDTGDGAEAGGGNPVELCEATVTTSGSDRKDSCDSGSSVLSAERPYRDAADPFGSGYLDISDSQLNTIVLIEEQPPESAAHEDATDLICGLVQELSSLNRKVMAAHRELQNVRRSSRGSRSSIC